MERNILNDVRIGFYGMAICHTVLDDHIECHRVYDDNTWTACCVRFASDSSPRELDERMQPLRMHCVNLTTTLSVWRERRWSRVGVYAAAERSSPSSTASAASANAAHDMHNTTAHQTATWADEAVHPPPIQLDYNQPLPALQPQLQMQHTPAELTAATAHAPQSPASAINATSSSITERQPHVSPCHEGDGHEDRPTLCPPVSAEHSPAPPQSPSRSASPSPSPPPEHSLAPSPSPEHSLAPAQAPSQAGSTSTSPSPSPSTAPTVTALPPSSSLPPAADTEPQQRQDSLVSDSDTDNGWSKITPRKRSPAQRRKLSAPAPTRLSTRAAAVAAKTGINAMLVNRRRGSLNPPSAASSAVVTKPPWGRSASK